jgi:hypothetical protein
VNDRDNKTKVRSTGTTITKEKKVPTSLGARGVAPPFTMALSGWFNPPLFDHNSRRVETAEGKLDDRR